MGNSFFDLPGSDTFCLRASDRGMYNPNASVDLRFKDLTQNLRGTAHGE